MPSFDVVCEIDLQEVDNALQQTLKELGTRFDFKGTTFEVRREGQAIHLLAADDFKLRALRDVLQERLARRQVPLKAIQAGTPESASGGAMRADGWNRIPLIRMTNINLLPVPGMSLDDIVADTDDGLYLSTNRSWSIDDRRLNFQFATEVAWEVKGGKLGRLFKNPTYTGITYEFWRSCDAVGDERSYVMLGTPNCGKGEPVQGAHVGHGVSGARFRNVQVGVGKW